MYVQRGVMLVMRGRMEEAEKEFRIASSLAPDKPLPYVAMSEVWMQSGQTQKAVDLLREKSSLPGTDFIVPLVFALALIRSGADAGTPQGVGRRFCALEEIDSPEIEFSALARRTGKAAGWKGR